MSYKELKEKAREKYNGSCRCCKVCNGVACAGEVPGMGGKGTGTTFINNRKALDKINLNMKVLHTASDPDTGVELFGRKLALPVMAAPITGTKLNMGGIVTEREYIEPVVEGCAAAGSIAMLGDTALDECLIENLEVCRKNDGNAIVFIKPWENKNVIEKIRLSEKAGAIAVGVDIDACGLVTLKLHGKPVYPKTVDEIKELVNSTELPFILKGIMTVEEALMAVEAGVYAIVVSNHGGRVLDFAPGTADVLEDIVKAVDGRIKVLVDGGIRTGVDVFKMLALGADAVLIGRPYITASFGGQADGVKEYTEEVGKQLYETMIMTGNHKIEDINSDSIYRDEK